MHIDPEKLTPEAHAAIVECLRIAARRGRQLREARERAQLNTSLGLQDPPPANQAEDSADPGIGQTLSEKAKVA